MWEPAISGMGNTHNCAPKLQAYPLIFSLTPKASGSTRLQSCEDKVFNSQNRPCKENSHNQKYSGRSPEPSDSERWDSRKPETTGIRSLYPALTEQKHRTWKRRTIKTCLGRRISGREQNCRRAYRPAPQETGVVR